MSVLAGCTTIAPPIESGRTAVEVRYFNGVNSGLSVKVLKIERVDTGHVVYREEDRKLFSGNSIELDQGSYLITYSCYIDTTQVAAIKFSGNRTPVITDRYKLVPGELFRLSYEFDHNIKYGNYCRSVYR